MFCVLSDNRSRVRKDFPYIRYRSVEGYKEKYKGFTKEMRHSKDGRCHVEKIRHKCGPDAFQEVVKTEQSRQASRDTAVTLKKQFVVDVCSLKRHLNSQFARTGPFASCSTVLET